MRSSKSTSTATTVTSVMNATTVTSRNVLLEELILDTLVLLKVTNWDSNRRSSQRGSVPSDSACKKTSFRMKRRSDVDRTPTKRRTTETTNNLKRQKAELKNS